MTMVKVKLKMAQLQSGEVLEVLLAGGEPLENVPRTAREEGHGVLEIRQEGENHRITIRKA
jgi:TusA-related sulfurtransferase